jgi:hypothetical protein
MDRLRSSSGKGRVAVTLSPLELSEASEGFQSIEFDSGNTWFAGLDAQSLYAMVRMFRPSRVIEIGSGHSTGITVAALKANTEDGFAGVLTAVDPDPRIALGPEIDHRRVRVESLPLSFFQGLVRDDILFIDSSHKWSPGNDVDILYGTILPSLADGVLVHIHDVFLPDPYPDAWADRRYDEQDHLSWVLEHGGWEIVWSCHQMDKSSSDLMVRLFSEYRRDCGSGSLWIRKSEGAGG